MHFYVFVYHLAYKRRPKMFCVFFIIYNAFWFPTKLTTGNAVKITVFIFRERLLYWKHCFYPFIYWFRTKNLEKSLNVMKLLCAMSTMHSQLMSKESFLLLFGHMCMLFMLWKWFVIVCKFTVALYDMNIYFVNYVAISIRHFIIVCNLELSAYFLVLTGRIIVQDANQCL